MGRKFFFVLVNINIKPLYCTKLFEVNDKTIKKFEIKGRKLEILFKKTNYVS